MVSVKKFLSSATGAGAILLLLGQGVGTTAGIYHFNNLSEISTENQLRTKEVNQKFEALLADSKYREVLNDPYFSSSEFLERNAVHEKGEKVYKEAIESHLQEIKTGIVDVYPLTSFAYDDLKEDLRANTSLDMNTYYKWKLAKEAESSCDSSYAPSNPAAVSLGQKYFCN